MHHPDFRADGCSLVLCVGGPRNGEVFRVTGLAFVWQGGALPGTPSSVDAACIAHVIAHMITAGARP